DGAARFQPVHFEHGRKHAAFSFTEAGARLVERHREPSIRRTATCWRRPILPARKLNNIHGANPPCPKPCASIISRSPAAIALRSILPRSAAAESLARRRSNSARACRAWATLARPEGRRLQTQGRPLASSSSAACQDAFARLRPSPAPGLSARAAVGRVSIQFWTSNDFHKRRLGVTRNPVGKPCVAMARLSVMRLLKSPLSRRSSNVRKFIRSTPFGAAYSRQLNW